MADSGKGGKTKEKEVGSAANASTQPAKAKREAPAEEMVVMEDGRKVSFVGKRRLNKESLIGDDGRVSIRLDFRGGQTRLFGLPDALVSRFAAHGAEQKLGDETAGLTDNDDAVEAIDALIGRLNKGEWTSRAEGTGFAGISILVRALAELYGKPVEKVKAFLSEKTHAEKVALRANPKVKPIIDRLEAEKASKGSKVDTDALLGEMAAID